ncbi:hypothetical protein [Vreelandella sedimenti]|uniref:hypothetical protein n=1 Tax=Vreelandella sedimenti TaxID=2729618 RepID=UPI00257C9777|nr:hypothetical protein [Halomonas sp. UBA3173]|tara:strand:- start:131406 stop:131789 length:384 start_codon:yes stop_codon:yes gene_type:complete
MNYTYAVVQDKEIMQIMSTPFLYVECADDVNDITHFYNTDTASIELKYELQYTLTTDGLEVTISGLPENLNVNTNNMHTMTDSEDLVIEYDIPGIYTIELSGRPEYLLTTIDVVVTEPEPAAGEGGE